MIIRNRTTKEARRAGKTTDGGATPGSVARGYTSAEGAAECLSPRRGSYWVAPLAGVITPACNLKSPSGFRGRLKQVLLAVIWSFWSFWSFVKIEIRCCQNRHYNINIIYLYIVSNDRVSEIDFDHFDLDHFDHVKT